MLGQRSTLLFTNDVDSETQVDSVDSQEEQEKAERGAKTAENVRYGQTISEGGMGGKTTESGGGANQGRLWRFLGGAVPINKG